MNKNRNIVLITVDSLRADHCGWLNPENKELTPFLNKLAKESFVFCNAYATGHCTPLAFPGILTGTYPLSFSGWNGKTFPGLDQRPFLPEILQKNGYFTLTVHDNPYLSSFFGYDRGFDVFKDLKMGSKQWFLRAMRNEENLLEKIFQKLNQISLYYYLEKFLRKFPRLYWFLIVIILKSRSQMELLSFASASEINEAVLEEMQFAEDPWFLFFHYTEPHEPYFPPKGILTADISEKDLKKLNFLFGKVNFSNEQVKLIKKIYQLKIQYLDQQIERLFIQLKDRFQNSIIVITADHGQEFGEHGNFGHGLDRTYPKLYKELLHVPLIIRVPGQKGKLITKPVSCAQIPATILSLVGIEPPSEMQLSLFNENEIEVYSESLLYLSALLDKFDLSTKQRVIHNK